LKILRVLFDEGAYSDVVREALAMVLGSFVLLAGGIWGWLQFDAPLILAVVAGIWLVGIFPFGYVWGSRTTSTAAPCTSSPPRGTSRRPSTGHPWTWPGR
jgi:hypothetical protein